MTCEFHNSTLGPAIRDPRWTHDPTATPVDYGPIDATHILTKTGWEVKGVFVGCDSNEPRCGEQWPHREIVSSIIYGGGACGAPPNHECPHVWIEDPYRVTSVSRRQPVDWVLSDQYGNPLPREAQHLEGRLSDDT